MPIDIYIAWSWQDRRFWAAIAGLCALLFFAGFSLLSAIGFAAENRGVLVDRRVDASNAYSRMQQELGLLESQRASLPKHRSASVVGADIQRHQQNRRWASTRECADATEYESREFCAAYFALRAELATGQDAARFTSQIATLLAEAERLNFTGAGQDVDPQVSILSHVLGLGAEPVRLGLIVAVALLVEVGASLGLFLASGHCTLSKKLPKRVIGSMEQFCLEALKPEAAGSVSVDALYQTYEAWCTASGFEPLSNREFETLFAALASEVGLSSNEQGFLGIGIAQGSQRLSNLRMKAA